MDIKFVYNYIHSMIFCSKVNEYKRKVIFYLFKVNYIKLKKMNKICINFIFVLLDFKQ